MMLRRQMKCALESMTLNRQPVTRWINTFPHTRATMHKTHTTSTMRADWMKIHHRVPSCRHRSNTLGRELRLYHNHMRAIHSVAFSVYRSIQTRLRFAWLSTKTLDGFGRWSAIVQSNWERCDLFPFAMTRCSHTLARACPQWHKHRLNNHISSKMNV